MRSGRYDLLHARLRGPLRSFFSSGSSLIFDGSPITLPKQERNGEGDPSLPKFYELRDNLSKSQVPAPKSAAVSMMPLVSQTPGPIDGEPVRPGGSSSATMRAEAAFTPSPL